MDAKAINKVVNDTLKLVQALPEDSPEDEQSYEDLVKEDQNLEEELKAAKARAEKVVDKIKLLRKNLADLVLQG